MRYIQLQTQLRKDQKRKTDIVTVFYYGYGVYNWQITKQVKDIPYTLLVSKCFKSEIMDGCKIYHVDGAL